MSAKQRKTAEELLAIARTIRPPATSLRPPATVMAEVGGFDAFLRLPGVWEAYAEVARRVEALEGDREFLGTLEEPCEFWARGALWQPGLVEAFRRWAEAMDAELLGRGSWGLFARMEPLPEMEHALDVVRGRSNPNLDGWLAEHGYPDRLAYYCETYLRQLPTRPLVDAP